MRRAEVKVRKFSGRQQAANRRCHTPDLSHFGLSDNGDDRSPKTLLSFSYVSTSGYCGYIELAKQVQVTGMVYLYFPHTLTHLFVTFSYICIRNLTVDHDIPRYAVYTGILHGHTHDHEYMAAGGVYLPTESRDHVIEHVCAPTNYGTVMF